MRVLVSCVALVAVLTPLPLAGADVAGTSPPVVDLHVDLSYRMNYGGGTLAAGSGQFSASRLLRGNVVGVVLPLFVPKRVSPEGPRAEDLLASFERLVTLLPRTAPYAPPGCAEEPAKVRTWLSFEGAGPLASDPDSVAAWSARGVKVFGFVHTWRNALATSSGDVPRPTEGLSDAGRTVLARVFAAGGLPDVSHASDAATDEMIRAGKAAGKPVIATHSNARAVTPHPRNLTDAQLRGIASTGGVVGINFHSRFLRASGRATIADVVRHALHLVKVAGAEHVAIGSDFEGDITPPDGLAEVGELPRLSSALRQAGLSDADIARIFAGNALRVLCPAPSPFAAVSDAPPLKK